MATLLTLSAAARAAGLPAETIRYYERVGVLPPAPRLANGYRGYPPEHLDSIRLARGLRDLGIPPATIGVLVRLLHDGSCPDVRSALSEAVAGALARLEARRRELDHLERRLAMLRSALGRVDPAGAIAPCPCFEAVTAAAGDAEAPCREECP